MFDRFDICSAWYVWAADWGEYEVITRLERLGFRPGLSVREGKFVGDEFDNTREILIALNERSLADPDWYKRKQLGRQAVYP